MMPRWGPLEVKQLLYSVTWCSMSPNEWPEQFLQFLNVSDLYICDFLVTHMDCFQELKEGNVFPTSSSFGMSSPSKKSHNIFMNQCNIFAYRFHVMLHHFTDLQRCSNSNLPTFSCYETCNKNIKQKTHQKKSLKPSRHGISSRRLWEPNGPRVGRFYHAMAKRGSGPRTP